MKKTLLVSFGVVVLAAALFWFFGIRQTKQTVATTYLPENVLCYYQQKNLGQSLSDLKKSPLGNNLGTIDVVQIAKELNLPDKDIALIEKIKGESSAFINSPLFKEIFSNDYAFALLPVDLSHTDDPREKLLKSLVLLARPRHGARLIDILSSQFGTLANQKTETYGDFTIKQFNLEHQTLCAVVVDDLLVITFDPKLLKSCIERHVKKASSLGENKIFTKVAAEFDKSKTFGYVSLKLLKKQLEILPITTGKKGKKNIKLDVKSLDGMLAAGFGIRQDSDKIRDKGIVLVDDQKIDPALGKLYHTSPEKNTSLEFIPEHVLGYGWSNKLDFLTYWKMYTSENASEKEDIEEIRKAVKKQFGMDIENILSLFDKQGGFIVQSADAKNFLPLPNICFYIRIKDEKRFAELIKQDHADSPFRKNIQQYKGVDIISLSDPSKGPLIRLYTMQNDYFIVSTSLEMMKQIIDAQKGGLSLKDNPGFKKISTELLEKNNSVGYINIGDVTKTVTELLNWGRALLSVNNQEDARRLGILQIKVFNPLLNGLAATFSDYAVYGRNSSDMNTVESVLLNRQ